MRWAKLIASSNSDGQPWGIVVDNNGHVYISGNFWHGNLTIGYDSVVPTSYQIAATMQFDTNGHFNWIRFVGPNTTGNRTASLPGYGALVLDKQQNVHFIKMYKAGSQITPSVLTTYGTYDVVYDQSGTLLSATKLQLDSALGIDGASIDTSTNKLYVFGENNSLLSSSGSYPSFAAAFDVNRSVLWLDTVFSPLTTGAFATFEAITTDGIGHIYLSGAGLGSVAFGGDTISNSPYSSNYLPFVMKIDTNAHTKWIRGYQTSGPSGQGYLAGITLMPNGKIASTGTMLGTITSGTFSITAYSGEGYNNYFTILDTAGDIHELQQIHSTGNYDQGNCVASDRLGNLYIGCDAGPSAWGGALVPYTAIGGNTDFVLIKYGVDCSCTSMPVASFTDTGNHNVGFTYTGVITGLDSVRWNFADGGTATVFNPTHTFTAAGTYHVSVSVYSACGNDIRYHDVYIPCVAAPVASFTITGVTATRNFSYTGATIGIDSVVWNFGDGGHATGLTSAHTYTAIGTYTVCATAYNPCGSNTVCNPVVITCVNHLTAAFTHTGYVPVSFTYTGTTTGMDSIVWHYGDGGHGTGTTSTHSYSAIGTHTVCVLAYNHCGVDSTCSTFTVPCVVAPTASFTQTGTTATHNFTYTGTTVALDSVVWNFGDGGHAVGLTAVHSYTAAGVYTACVTAYSPCGSNAFCNTVLVLCVTAPVAAFTNTGSPSVNFTYTGTTVGIDSVVWNFGDGGHATGLTTSHLYAVADTYNVCVTAYNHCGWDSACSTVIVTCPVPVASFTHIGAPAVSFNYTGTTVSVDSIVWSFGDGGSDTGISPTHSYAVSDTYHVCVIVYTLCGSDSVCADLTATGLGISILSLANIQVYPNPATDELNITGIPAITGYRLLNVTGVSLQQGMLQRGSNSIVMKNYAPGIYMMELTGMDGSKNIARIVKL